MEETREKMVGTTSRVGRGGDGREGGFGGLEGRQWGSHQRGRQSATAMVEAVVDGGASGRDSGELGLREGQLCRSRAKVQGKYGLRVGSHAMGGGLHVGPHGR